MPRVLLVENDPPQLQMYVKALQDHYEVVAVGNGYDALGLDWLGFDCCVVDLYMPGLPGDEVIRRAADCYGDRLPPCILFTASPKFITKGIHIPATVLLKGDGNKSSVLQSLRDQIDESISVRA